MATMGSIPDAGSQVQTQGAAPEAPKKGTSAYIQSLIDRTNAALGRYQEMYDKYAPAYFGGGAGDKSQTGRNILHADTNIKHYKRNLGHYQAALTKALNRELIDSRIKAADEFQAKLPQYIADQTGAARSQIGQELKNTTRDIRGSANSRGMLFSGARMGQEGAASNEASSQLASMRGNIIRSALDQANQMYTDPLLAKSNQRNAALRGQQGIQAMQQQYQGQQQAGLNSGMGLIGQGLGSYLGQQQSSSKPQSQQGAVAGSNRYASNYFGY